MERRFHSITRQKYTTAEYCHTEGTNECSISICRFRQRNQAAFQVWKTDSLVTAIEQMTL